MVYQELVCVLLNVGTKLVRTFQQRLFITIILSVITLMVLRDVLTIQIIGIVYLRVLRVVLMFVHGMEDVHRKR